MSLIQEIVLTTLKTIKSYKTLSFEENLAILKELTKKITLAHLYINSDFQNDRDFSENSAPVAYSEICHNPHFSMGVFVIKPGCRMPMHNHPNMHGLLKVLHGSSFIRSFNVQQHQIPGNTPPLIKIIKQTSTELTPDSDPVILTPDDGNIHEIIPLVAPNAFLDILFPPYDDSQRVGSYYKQVFYNKNSNTKVPNNLNISNNDHWIKEEKDQVESKEGMAETVTESTEEPEGAYLVEIPPPADFWCSTLTYKGPTVPQHIISDLMKDA